MTSLILTPDTATVSGWLILAGCALLFITLVTGLGDWLAHCRRSQSSVVPKPSIDDLVRFMGDEQEQMRLDRQRIDDRRAAEMHE